MRILGLIFSFINIGVKVVLIFLYYKLAREKQDKGFLALDDEISINEVDEEEYLAKNNKDTDLANMNLIAWLKIMIF